MNLVRNGSDAINEVDMVGDLRIRSERNSLDQLLISIRYTGIGLRPERTDKIFDALFTTKPQGTRHGPVH
jgi:signal transduction histidine kinase